MAPSPVDLLRSWSTDRSPTLDAVVGALASSDADVDAFLSKDPLADRFAKDLIGDHVFELGFALDDGAALPSRRWLALARLTPGPFAWNLEPERVLPMDDPALARELEALLLASLPDRENRSVLLSWLAHPEFLAATDAIDRIEDSLAGSGAALTWADRLTTVKALARRGGAWEAARALERLIRRAQPELEEARVIQKVAVSLADTTLLTVLGAQQVWRDQPEWLQELAAELPTDELIAGFAPEAGERMARRLLERPGPAHRAAWNALARRGERRALDAVGRLIVRCAMHLRDDGMTAELVGAARSTHRTAAVAPLTAAFLAGLHRTGCGPSVERFLAEHPLDALTASLELLPDWMATFDEDAMGRLCFRLLPRVDADGRARLARLALAAGGSRARIFADEADALV